MTPEPSTPNSLFERTLARFSKGVHGRLYVPVTMGGVALELRIFTQARRNAIEFGLYLPTRRYARKMLVLRRDGRCEFDDEGVIPEFDRHDMDLTFNPSIDEVVAVIEQALATGKISRGAH